MIKDHPCSAQLSSPLSSYKSLLGVGRRDRLWRLVEPVLSIAKVNEAMAHQATLDRLKSLQAIKKRQSQLKEILIKVK